MADPAFCIEACMFKAQVGVWRDFEGMHEFLRDQGARNFEVREANAAVVSIMAGGSRWFAMVIPTDCDVPVMAHECLHMAEFILDAAGVPFTKGNSECRAYLMEHLLRELMNA